ncbi:hypothetical protein TRFO_33278 [Tritrichomonas foetus]|uniref:Protein kinase domain-containing protein n=1 Tax=Tritrichomonas foetus TaxID=1144522 RepID=A0A1J4JN73_9EUKA|nr:hypothetical protein TRFO_33278 [Tritrichomonas foetus]|eukprot:OHT00146.1 hypothetical protein TRFO_33278 [Tritrichomonas foetus]
MNRDLIQKDFALIAGIEGNTVACLSPQSYQVTMTQNDQSISLTFFIPTKYPSVAPLCSISDSNNINNIAEIESRVKECCTFIKNQENLFLMIILEIRSILWNEIDSSSQDVRFPDSIETSRLIVETTLNQNIGDEWIRKRINSFQPPKPFGQDKLTRDALLIYCFFRACSGDYSLEECAHILTTQFHAIEPPCPPISSIPMLISNFLDDYKTLPAYLQDLFQAADNNASQTMSFFNDFTVISLCAPSVVRARNRVDRRIYAIKVIFLKDKTTVLPPEITQITQLQHRYIVRYYNSWINECNADDSRSISDAFCLSPPIKTPANFLFMQMDYLNGKPLSEMLHDPHFFEMSGFQWRITQQILEALHYLHSHNFVHNSMTTTSIIVDNENAKMGDFSDRTKLPPFPYCDPRGVMDIKSDMFAFGVVFFEMWHPFQSEDERLRILTKLVKNGEVPEQWSVVFPLQAKIVSLLMQPEQNRPLAIELLPLIPTNEVEKDSSDLLQLTKAISAGNLKLESHAPEVLASLFMESRKLPFRLNDFHNPREIFSTGDEQNGTIQDLTRGFETFMILNFYRIAQTFGAKFYVSNFLQPLSDKEGIVTIMSQDGVLHGLKSSCTLSYVNMVKSQKIQSLKTCTRITTLHESTGSVDRISEDDILSFDTVSKKKSIYNYFDHMQFIVQYIATVFPASIYKLTLRISHTPLMKWLNTRYPKITNMKLDYFRNVIRRSDEDTSEIDQYIEELNILVSFITRAVQLIARPFELPIIINSSAPTKKIGTGFVIKITVANTVVAYSGCVTYKNEQKEMPWITSTRILLLNALSTFKLGKNYKPNANEVFIVLVCQPFQPTEPLQTIPRKVYPGKVWSNAYVQMQPIVSQIRRNNIAASFAPNDGESVQHHMNEAEINFIPLVMVVYVDDRNKITIRFSSYSPLQKNLETQILSDQNMKRRVTIQPITFHNK